MAEFSELAFTALDGAAHRVPDSVFHKIPFAGPRYFKPKEIEERKQKHDKMQRDRSPRDPRRSDSGSWDSDSESDYDRRRRDKRSSRHSRRDRDRDDRRERGRDVVRERGYESDHAPTTPATYSGMPYFPPPPRVAVDAPQEGQAQGGAYVPAPYHPSKYGERPGSRDGYYAGHPQEQQPYAPPPPPGGPGSAYSQPGVATSQHSSAADKYLPSDRGSYERGPNPRQGSPNPDYPSALAVRNSGDYSSPYPEYPSPGYNTYQPPLEGSPEPRSRRDRSRENRSRSRDSHGRQSSRDRSSKRSGRSRSRVAETREKGKELFDKHKKELLLGALALGVGGLVLKGRHKNTEKKYRRSRDSYHDGYDSY